MMAFRRIPVLPGSSCSEGVTDGTWGLTQRVE